MDNMYKQSRSNKFEKRRKNTKKISILMVIASILIVILCMIWIFGGKDEEPSSSGSNDPTNENIENDDNSNSNINGPSENQIKEDTGTNTVDDFDVNEDGNHEGNVEEDQEVEIEQAEPSDDNVIEAYTGNWQPIGTTQEGPHTTNYDNGSQDRIEVKQAIMAVTGLDEGMTEHWIGNGGDQKVIATVSGKGNEEIYRVYLSWIDQKGWQVTKVEKLKEI